MKVSYPVNVGKKKITGPVLKAHYEQAAALQSNINAAKQREAAKKRKSEVDDVLASQDTQQTGYLSSKASLSARHRSIPPPNQ